MAGTRCTREEELEPVREGELGGKGENAPIRADSLNTQDKPRTVYMGGTEYFQGIRTVYRGTSGYILGRR